jgi:hypothetical protein
VDTEELAGMKLGIGADEDIFYKTTSDLSGWKKEDAGLYSSLKEIFMKHRMMRWYYCIRYIALFFFYEIPIHQRIFLCIIRLQDRRF